MKRLDNGNLYHSTKCDCTEFLLDLEGDLPKLLMSMKVYDDAGKLNTVQEFRCNLQSNENNKLGSYTEYEIQND